MLLHCCHGISIIIESLSVIIIDSNQDNKKPAVLGRAVIITTGWCCYSYRTLIGMSRQPQMTTAV